MRTWFTAFAFPSMALVAWQSLSIMQNLWYGLKNKMGTCFNDALYHQGAICDCKMDFCLPWRNRSLARIISVARNENKSNIHSYFPTHHAKIVGNCYEALKYWAYHNHKYRETILTHRPLIKCFYFSILHIIYNDTDLVKSHMNPWNICYGVGMSALRSKHIHNNGLSDFMLARIMPRQFQGWV